MDTYCDRQHGSRGSTPHLDIHHGCIRASFGSHHTFSYKMHNKRPTPKKRGDVERFSPASRRRMRRTLAQLRLPELPPVLFVTLTYHNKWENRLHSRDLANWFRSIKHHFGDLHYIWRCELQKRGAPHFHVMVWQKIPSDISDAEYLRSLRMMWIGITDQGTKEHRKHGFHSARPDSGLGAVMAYLRKYLAKEDSPSNDHPYRGRRWAASRGLPTDAYIRVDMSHSQVISLRRMAKRLLKSRFRGQKNRKQRVHLMTCDEYMTIYIPWVTIIRWMEFHGMYCWLPEDIDKLPWDNPHV